jgi:hypothetical protein
VKRGSESIGSLVVNVGTNKFGTGIRNAGADVMITIFCDFGQFSAKKIGVFLKNQCYDQIFALPI